MALGHRNVAGLTGHEARVMKRGQLVRELDEPLKVLECPIAASLLEIAHEWWSIHGRKDLCGPANADRAGKISSHLRELSWSTRQQMPDHVRRNAHATVTHIRAGDPPALERTGRIAKLNAVVLQQPERLAFDSLESVLVEKGVIGNGSRHICGSRALFL